MGKTSILGQVETNTAHIYSDREKSIETVFEK
jgi:hypothetical protein